MSLTQTYGGPNRWEPVMQNQSVVGICLLQGVSALLRFGQIVGSRTKQGGREPSSAIVITSAGFSQQVQALGETPGLGLSQCFIVLVKGGFNYISRLFRGIHGLLGQPVRFTESAVVSLDPCFLENHRTCHDRDLAFTSP